MNDYFVRDRVQQLTGLTRMTQKTGVVASLTDSTWVTIYSESATEQHQILKAYRVLLGTGVSSAELRILAAHSDAPGAATDNPVDNKTFPFGNSIEVLSGVDQILDFPLQIPKTHEFYIQVMALGSGANFTATLDYLSVIQVPLLNVT
jgi:hypothetical protein